MWPKFDVSINLEHYICEVLYLGAHKVTVSEIGFVRFFTAVRNSSCVRKPSKLLLRSSCNHIQCIMYRRPSSMVKSLRNGFAST